MANKCPEWKKDSRLSGFPPAKDHPDSCLGCDGLKSDTHEGWYCKKHSGIDLVPYPDLQEGIRCNYCWRNAKDTKRCQIKSENFVGAAWAPRIMDLCARCRKYLHGLFKYVKEKEK